MPLAGIYLPGVKRFWFFGFFFTFFASLRVKTEAKKSALVVRER